ncbi:MAG: DUF1275 domain-containing protein [Neisseriaceae bacterium]|nr:DUF1275 domain-containing protein [Neisseriaceae bacterium]
MTTIKKRRKRRVANLLHARMHYLHENNISFANFRRLGYLMAFLGGAINAGGFFAVAHYTSHMSGEMANIADSLYLGHWKAALTSFLMLLSFIFGAAHSSWTILWAKRQRFRSSFGLSMWLEALYMLAFGLLATLMNKFGDEYLLWSPTVMTMCFIMGMHNTVMTILSNGVVRTTHMTGFATDIGIELSKILYYRRSDNPKLPDVQVNIPKIKLFSGVMFNFILGGFFGAWSVNMVGYQFVWPVAFVLFLVGFTSIGYDVQLRWRIWLYKRNKKRHHTKA